MKAKTHKFFPGNEPLLDTKQDISAGKPALFGLHRDRNPDASWNELRWTNIEGLVLEEKELTKELATILIEDIIFAFKPAEAARKLEALGLVYPEGEKQWTVKEDGEPNRYTIFGENGRWLMSVLHNGEQGVPEQRENIQRLVAELQKEQPKKEEQPEEPKLKLKLKQSKADTWETEGKRIMIHGHINYPGEWLFTCRELDMHGVRLGAREKFPTHKELLDAIYDRIEEKKAQVENVLSLLIRYE